MSEGTSPSSPVRRALTNAEIMKKAVDKSKQITGDKSYERKQLKAYTSICHIYGMSAKEFKDHWYGLENPGKDIAAYLMDMFPGTGLGRIRVYKGQVQSLGLLLSGELCKSPLWNFFVEVWSQCMGLPIVPFYVKGVKDMFVLTNDDGKGNRTTQNFMPRLRVPTQGQSNDVYIYPLYVFLKENSENET